MLAIAVCLGFAVHALACSSGAVDDAVVEEALDVEDTLASEVVEVVDYTPKVSDFKNMPASSKVETFSLAGGTEAPELTDDCSDAIASALADVESTGDCSFLMVSLSTGQGIAYQRNKDIYSASTIKVPYITYLLMSGKVGGVANGAEPATSIEAAIAYSDNDSYNYLRASYGADGFATWLADMGIDEDVAGDDYNYYADYSATDLGKIWLKTYKYLDSGTDDAEWLAGLLTETSMSFIRDGVGSEDVTVWNKAGWINEGEGYESTSDAGIVEDGDGNEYLMVILTSQPYTDEAAENTSALAAALFEAREFLSE